MSQCTWWAWKWTILNRSVGILINAYQFLNIRFGAFSFSEKFNAIDWVFGAVWSGYMDCSSVQCAISSSLFIYSSLLYNLCKTKKLSGFGSTDCLHFNEEKMRERKKMKKTTTTTYTWQVVNVTTNVLVVLFHFAK